MSYIRKKPNCRTMCGKIDRKNFILGSVFALNLVISVTSVQSWCGTVAHSVYYEGKLEIWPTYATEVQRLKEIKIWKLVQAEFENVFYTTDANMYNLYNQSQMILALGMNIFDDVNQRVDELENKIVNISQNVSLHREIVSREVSAVESCPFSTPRYKEIDDWVKYAKVKAQNKFTDLLDSLDDCDKSLEEMSRTVLLCRTGHTSKEMYMGIIKKKLDMIEVLEFRDNFLEKVNSYVTHMENVVQVNGTDDVRTIKEESDRLLSELLQYSTNNNEMFNKHLEEIHIGLTNGFDFLMKMVEDEYKKFDVFMEKWEVVKNLLDASLEDINADSINRLASVEIWSVKNKEKIPLRYEDHVPFYGANSTEKLLREWCVGNENYKIFGGGEKYTRVYHQKQIEECVDHIFESYIYFHKNAFTVIKREYIYRYEVEDPAY